MKKVTSCKLFIIFCVILFSLVLSSCNITETNYNLQLEKEQIIKIEITYIKKEREYTLIEDRIELDFESGISDVVDAIENISYFEKKIDKNLDFAYHTIDLVIYSDREILNITYKEFGVKNGYVLYGDLNKWYGIQADIVSIFYEQIKYKIEEGIYNVV